MKNRGEAQTKKKKDKMANHIVNKIIFNSENAHSIISSLLNEQGEIDFNILIPTPLHVYQADLGKEEEKDFKANWLSWNRANWGTKWNAYSTYHFVSDNPDNPSLIQFLTAWGVPYPFIIAFLNKYKVDFTLEYADEGYNFWGVEEYNGKATSRVSKRYSEKDDEKRLYFELFGREETDDDE